MLTCVCCRNSTASAESNAATWSTDKFETIYDFDMAQAAPATAAGLLKALEPVDPLYACCDPRRSGSGMHQSWEQWTMEDEPPSPQAGCCTIEEAETAVDIVAEAAEAWCPGALASLVDTLKDLHSNHEADLQGTSKRRKLTREQLKRAGIKEKRAGYKPDQQKQIRLLFDLFDTKTAAQKYCRTIPGYEKLTYQMVDRWNTHKVKKKRGRKVCREFEDEVVAQCILNVLDNCADNAVIIAHANVAYSYEVFKICARNVKDRWYTKDGEKTQK